MHEAVNRGSLEAMLARLSQVNRDHQLLDEKDAQILRLVVDEAAKRAESTAQQVLKLLELLRNLRFGLPIDQLTHSLQTAARAEQAGADDEWVVAALCHDVGKVIPHVDHEMVAASLLQPYVRPEITQVIGNHNSLQHGLWERIQKDLMPLARRFVEEWDLPSFDPDYPTPELAHFEGRIHAVFSPRLRTVQSASRIGVQGKNDG